MWQDFVKFVNDAVEDPANRALTVMLSYKSAHQKDRQSVQAFATELGTLEEQIDPYTPE